MIRPVLKSLKEGSAVSAAGVQFIALDDLDWLFVERLSPTQSMSAHRVKHIAAAADALTPASILMLDDEDRLQALIDLRMIGTLQVRDLHSCHVLAFAPAVASELWKHKRIKRLSEGRWLCAVDQSVRPKTVVFDLLDTSLLRPWFASVAEPQRHPANISGADRPGWDAYEVWRQIQNARHRTAQEKEMRRASEARTPEAPRLDPVGQAIAIRSRLRKSVRFVDAGEWARWRGIGDTNPSAALGKHKQKGRVFAVQEGNKDLYPAFQFSENAEPLPVMSELLVSVPREAHGWPLLSWFEARNVLLKNQKPSEVIGREPAAVVAAATEFYSPQD